MQQYRMTTFLENLEMSGILTAVRDITESQGSVREKSCQGKVTKNFIVSCIFAFVRVIGSIQLVPA